MAEKYRVRAIVFDLDGVLVDSMPSIRQYWSNWARLHGVAAETVLASLHLTAEELIKKFAPDLEPSTEARAAAASQASLETGIEALEGSRTLIDGLPRNAWAVVTSGRRELALQHLTSGHLPVPDVLITAEDTPRGKPDPTGYLLAASSLGIPPGECLGIEDSPAGIRAALQAGMTVLGVTNSHSAKELSQAHAVISSLAGLRASVDNARWPPELIVSLSNATVSADSQTDPQ